MFTETNQENENQTRERETVERIWMKIRVLSHPHHLHSIACIFHECRTVEIHSTFDGMPATSIENASRGNSKHTHVLR